MSEQNMTGQRRVGAAAEIIRTCPYEAARSTDIAQLATGGNQQPARLRRLGAARVIAEYLADTLPLMQEAHPPYGIPAMYSPDLLLNDPSKEYTPFEEKLGLLNRDMKVKLRTHIFDGVGKFGSKANGLAVLRLISGLPEWSQSPRGAMLSAVDALETPAVRGIDNMLGTFHVTPKVYENQFGRSPTHDEVIGILKKSKRVIVHQSLHTGRQATAFLIQISKSDIFAPEIYGLELEPKKFTIVGNEDQKTARIDFCKSIGKTLVPKYARGKRTMIPIESMSPEGEALTCPSRALINAMWDDMVHIADQTRVFEAAE